MKNPSISGVSIIPTNTLPIPNIEHMLRVLPRVATSWRELQGSSRMPTGLDPGECFFLLKWYLRTLELWRKQNRVPKIYQVRERFWLCPGIQYLHALMTSNKATHVEASLELQKAPSPLTVIRQRRSIPLKALAE